MARNFSEDGAVGAGGGDGSAPSMTPSIMNGFNMSGTPADQSSTMPIGAIPESDAAPAPRGGGWNAAARSGYNPESLYRGGSAPMGGWGPDIPGNFAQGSSMGAINYGDAAGAWNFSQGGAIDDGDADDVDPNATDPQGSMMGNSLQRSINQALSTVNDVLSYGRKLHGIGGGQKQAMNTEGFVQSGNIEDRRESDNSPDPNSFGESMKRRVGSRVDQVRNMFGPDQTKNKMSQDAGINDIGSSSDAQPTAQAGAQQAIPTDDEEEAQ